MQDRAILIVDDEPRMAQSLRDLLREAGYTAEAASDAGAALAALADGAYRVLITDLRMPGVGGLELIRQVHERWPRMLIIVITGHASTESAIEAVHQNVFDYIRKPFDFNFLRATVEKAFERLETEQLREDTAAMISHDIKIPLTAIIGFASMIRDRETGRLHPRTAEFAATIEANGEKILGLIENYLVGCRIESGALPCNPTPVDLRGMIDDLLATAQFGAARCEAVFVRELAGLPPRALLDERLVDRALSNLIRNALKYRQGEGPIRVIGRTIEPAATPLGRPAVLLGVENPCGPLAPEELEGIFQRYRRGRLTQGIEGSGLGLYVVEAVARAHGGRAGAELRAPGRVRFYIELPLVVPPRAGEAAR